MKEVLNVFFATSEEYVQHFTVAATSLLENNKDLHLNIYVLHQQMEMAALNISRQFIQDRYGVALQCINIGNIDFSRFRTNDYFGKYTYYRLFLPEVAPQHIVKALFLDVDVVITGSLKELAVTELHDYSIAAVSETSIENNVERLNKLGEPVTSYFNAGVLLINLETWRNQRLTESFIRIADKYKDKLQWVDQDILNIHFASNWLELNNKYNGIHILEKLPQTPVIIHYNTFSKPWHYVDTHPYNYLYRHYLELTPFSKSVPSGFSIRNFILKYGRLVKRQLRRKGLIK